MGLEARAREHVLLDEQVAPFLVRGPCLTLSIERPEAIVFAAEADPRHVAGGSARARADARQLRHVKLSKGRVGPTEIAQAIIAEVPVFMVDAGVEVRGGVGPERIQHDLVDA